MKICFLILLLISTYSFSQDIPVKSKLVLLSYLANGKIIGGYCRNATASKKGICWMEFACKEGFFTPESDTISILSNHLMSAIETYVLSDSANSYDTAGIQFVIRQNGVKKSKGWGFRTSLQHVGKLTLDDRLQILLNVLPFRNGQATRNDDSVEFVLHEVAGYSPSEDLDHFATVLGFVVYDFVYNRKAKQVIVDFVDDERHRVVKILARMDNIRSVLKIIRKGKLV